MTSSATVPGAGDAETSCGAGEARSAGPRFSDRALAAIVAAVTLPIAWMGYGTDIDVTDVIAAGDRIRAGDYRPSRPPGVPVVEAITAVLDPIGGHLLVNLATAAAAAAAVIGLARLVRAWGHDNGDLISLAFLASPVVIIASSSLADFMWAVAFLVWGMLAHLRDRRLLPGVLFALAIGSRLSTGLVVAAFLLADGWSPSQRRRCVRTALVMGPLALALYVPSWLAYDRTLGFLESSEGYQSLRNNLGRLLYKGYTTTGIALIVVLLVALPALLSALRRWQHDPMLRFAVLAFAATVALFFVMPWKLAHLIPTLMAAVLWLGASRRNRRSFLWVVIAATALNGLVTFRPLAPDVPGASTSGEWDPHLTTGLLVNDIDCRLDAMREPLEPLNAEAWSCSLRPLRGMTETDDDGRPDSG